MRRFVVWMLGLLLMIGICLILATGAGKGDISQAAALKEPTYELWDQPTEEDLYTFLSEKMKGLNEILANVSAHADNEWASLETVKELKKNVLYQEDYRALKNWAYGAQNFDFTSYHAGVTQLVAEYFATINLSVTELADNLPKWMFADDTRVIDRCIEDIKEDMAVIYSVATQGDMPELITGQEIAVGNIGTLKYRSAGYREYISSVNKGSLNYEVKSPDNIYLVIEFSFKNESSETVIDSIGGMLSAIVVYSHGHSYSATMMAEASNRSGISQMFFVEPETTVRVLAVVEVPKTVQSEVALANLWVAGTQYKITL